MSQQRLPPAGMDYPARVPYFANHYLRQAKASGAVKIMGTEAYALLAVVVLDEDQLRYGRPPSYWNSNLADQLGWSVDKLDRIRSKLIAMDLLHYDRSHCREEAIYWVKTPAWFVPPAAEPSAVPSAPLRNIRTHAEGIAEHPAEGSAEGTAEPPIPDSCIPVFPDSPPKPSPPSPSPAPSVQEWERVRGEILAAGVREADGPMQQLRLHQVPASLVRAVLRLARETGAWEGGKLRRRLINLQRGQDPRDLELWPAPDHPQKLPAALRAPSPAEQAEATRRDENRRLHQLLMDFGDELKGKTIPEIVSTFEIPQPLQQHLARYQRWEHVRSGAVQLAVLEIVSRHMTPNPN